MGGSEAKASQNTDVVNDALTNIIMNSSNECSSKNANIQEIEIANLDLVGCDLNMTDISQKQTIKQNFSCLQDTSNKTDLVNRFSTELDAKVEAQAKAGVGVAISKTDSVTKLKNTIKNNMDISNVAQCIQENINAQKMSVGGIKMKCVPGQKGLDMSRMNQTIISENTASCYQKNEAVAAAASELNNKITVSSSSTAKGWDPLEFLQTWWMILFIAFIILVISSSVSSMMAGGGGGGSSSGSETQQSEY
jgi:hypothetical protein